MWLCFFFDKGIELFLIAFFQFFKNLSLVYILRFRSVSHPSDNQAAAYFLGISLTQLLMECLSFKADI